MTVEAALALALVVAIVALGAAVLAVGLGPYERAPDLIYRMRVFLASGSGPVVVALAFGVLAATLGYRDLGALQAAIVVFGSGFAWRVAGLRWPRPSPESDWRPPNLRLLGAMGLASFAALMAIGGVMIKLVAFR